MCRGSNDIAPSFLPPLLLVFFVFQYIRAELTIVCDGCFSKFRTGLVKAPITVHSHFVGVVMKDCPQFTPDHAELVLVKCGGPVLIYQIGSHETRVLVDVREPLPKDMRGYLLDIIAPQLPGMNRGCVCVRSCVRAYVCVCVCVCVCE